MAERPTRVIIFNLPALTNNLVNRIAVYRSRIPLGELIDFPPAMTPTQLQEIPKAIINKEQADLLIQCAVCFHEFKLNDDDVRKLPCNHMYHDECIFPWLQTNPSCPTCREPLPNQNHEGFEDAIRQHFDRLTNDLMHHLVEQRHEFGQVPDDENSSTDTLSDENRSARSGRPAENRSARFSRPAESRSARSSRPVENRSARSSRPAMTVNDAENVRVPRRAAALRASRALRRIYLPREQPDFH